MIIVAAAIICLFVLLIIFKKLYKKPAANMAFVRTGQGGIKVALDKGMFVIGLFHKLKPISLETLRVPVTCDSANGLITSDAVQVEMTVEFLVRIPREMDAIVNAATSLGDKSLSPEEVKRLIEPKLLGALREAAASMDWLGLRGNPEAFNETVLKEAREKLFINGLLCEGMYIITINATENRFGKVDNL
jgi:uncharacterized membrane protein YqiK